MALRARLFVQKAKVCSGGHSGHSGCSGHYGHSVPPVVQTLRSFQLCDRHSYILQLSGGMVSPVIPGI